MSSLQSLRNKLKENNIIKVTETKELTPVKAAKSPEKQIRQASTSSKGSQKRRNSMPAMKSPRLAEKSEETNSEDTPVI